MPRSGPVNRPLSDVGAPGPARTVAERTTASASRSVNLVVGAVYLLVGVIGLFILHSSMNLLALNGLDNGLHFASALVLLGSAAAGGRARA